MNDWFNGKMTISIFHTARDEDSSLSLIFLKSKPAMSGNIVIGILIMFICIYTNCYATPRLHNTIDSIPIRTLRYHPEGNNFVIVNGKKKFNRSLYGWQTAFRIETGDLPEFAMYMPGTGGCLKLGVINKNISKWAESFSYVESRYHAGKMIYILKDSIIGSARIIIEVVPLYTCHGMGVKIQTEHVKQAFQLILTFGGAGGIYPPRNGDLGADSPAVFDITPEHCLNNRFQIHPPYFSLTYKNKTGLSSIEGVWPEISIMKISDTKEIEDPKRLIHASPDGKAPVLVGIAEIHHDTDLYLIIKQKDTSTLSSGMVREIFHQADDQRREIAGRIYIHTPDSFMNPIGGAISIASNAIWQDSVFMHGAVAWRMPYNGWRGAYVANDLGWHQRGKIFFQAYNKSQLTAPDTSIVSPDPKTHLSRQTEKIGLGIYNSGYISRYPNGKLIPGHYDMNLVYIDAMIRYFQWTDDTNFIRICWPVIKRHLEWEKRNFDQDHDHLYDAYACIWASDALEYNGGDVTYSSAYNYFENKYAATLASILHENPAPFKKESEEIRRALNEKLWIPDGGWYAEYLDLIGAKNIHPDAGLWTVYHAIDEEVPDVFQTYQLLQYVDHHIPHRYFTYSGTQDKYVELSTTDWMPYAWSVNNVAMAEMAHAALAYWQGRRKQKAYQLWKSLILESMYLGSCPGNFEQLSSLDHFRGELYRDFADAIGICSRALVEGLFGIRPDALHHLLTIVPGWPEHWNYATIHIPDIHMEFHRNNQIDHYQIQPHFYVPMSLNLILPANHTFPYRVWINQHQVNWKYDSTSIGYPYIIISFPPQSEYNIYIQWSHDTLDALKYHSTFTYLDTFHLHTKTAEITRIYDPQHILQYTFTDNHHLFDATFSKNITGHHTFFIQLHDHDASWWYPVTVELLQPISINVKKKENQIYLQLINNTHHTIKSKIHVRINAYSLLDISNVPAYPGFLSIMIPDSTWLPGTNHIQIFSDNDLHLDTTWTDWDWKISTHYRFNEISCDSFFNGKVQNIFLQQYLSPRPHVPTLQLPLQGIGNWTAPLIQPPIDISGWVRNALNGETHFPNGITMICPEDSTKNNIAYVSIWSNYPDSLHIPLHHSARHAYFLMTGTTNYMQSRIPNGKIIAWYTDGTCDSLLLINPDTWWPIEQDYYIDSFAFPDQTDVPYRLHLKTGEITRHYATYTSIPGFTNRAIDGGAATLLDMPLNPAKTIDHFTIQATANEVIIGLMGITWIQ